MWQSLPVPLPRMRQEGSSTHGREALHRNPICLHQPCRITSSFASLEAGTDATTVAVPRLLSLDSYGSCDKLTEIRAQSEACRGSNCARLFGIFLFPRSEEHTSELQSLTKL